MTTAANAISSFVEIGTITPGYAAVRAHRPLQGRLASRKALLTSTVLAGSFGLVAAEAIAQQYNLPGSGGFTDVSSSINVVTDAGGGNIRVVLADGVQFFAAPGQYQLNPMTSSLQVATDVLLNAYTGAAPVAAQQTQQAFSASQAQAYTTPTVYPANAALTLGANQYATQASVVGGYQMQPAAATYSAPSMAYGAQSGQYVPAYSAGVAGYGQVPSYATYSGAGTAASTFGGMQPTPVSSAVPTNQMAMAPAVPAANAAASGGMLGIPTWALVGGGVAAGGAALLALGSLGGESSASTNSGSGLSISEQAYLNNPEVQAALGNTNSGNQATSGSTSGGSSGGSTTTTTSGGITVSGGSSGSSSSSNNDSGSSYTVPAGSSGQTITGSSADDTVTFTDGGNVESIASIDLKGGDGDRVILKDVDENLDIPDLQNVEFLDIELSADNLEIDLQDIGSEVNNVTVDANDSYDFTVDNADAVDKITVKDAGNETATINDIADQSTVALEDSEDLVVTMKSGSDNELTVSVSAVTDADIALDTNVDDLTISSVGSSPNVIANITANSATTLELTGSQDLEIEEVIGAGGLAKVTTVSGGAADGELTLTLDGTTIESVVLGDGGDDLTIDDALDANAEVSTGDGNDDVTINAMVDSGTVNTGAGADDIVLNVSLAADETIDGGAGSNDEITLNATVNLGAVTGVEIVNIQAAATVDFDNFTGVTDVNILTTGAVVVDKLVTSEVDTIADADLTIQDMASGSVATFDAAGSLTIASSDTGLTDIVADLNTGILTINAASTSAAVTDVTVTSSGNISFAGNADQLAELRDLDATGVSGTFAASGMSAITAYEGAGGADALAISGVNASATINLNGGDDDFTSTATAGTVNVHGNAGVDTFDFNGTAKHRLHVDAADDVATVTLAAASTVAVLTTFETVENFATGVDRVHLTLSLTGMDLYDAATAGSATAAFEAARDDLLSSAANIDVAIYDDGIDTYVMFDANDNDSTVGVIKLEAVTNASTATDFII
ncbi:MAG: hypothetical protein CME02_01100 [Geminicoccus sp.]|nr:hypothetical protein [Geminicoccus sp.]